MTKEEYQDKKLIVADQFKNSEHQMALELKVDMCRQLTRIADFMSDVMDSHFGLAVGKDETLKE